jgi:hypothetical protein
MRYPQAPSPEAVEDLESQLKRSLRRVEPREEFVDHLYGRLTSPPAMTVERRTNTAFGLLLVAFSLVSGFLVVWLMRQLRAA